MKGDMRRLWIPLCAPAIAVAIGISMAWACGAPPKATAISAGKVALADVVDCTSGDRAKVVAQFGPTMEQLLQRAVGLDGRVDMPSLEGVTHSLEADGWCVLEHAAIQLMSAALTKIPGAPQSAAAPLDAPDLAAKLARLRVEKFGATQFTTGAQ
jgi:hypothetical protein